MNDWCEFCIANFFSIAFCWPVHTYSPIQTGYLFSTMVISWYFILIRLVSGAFDVIFIHTVYTKLGLKVPMNRGKTPFVVPEKNLVGYMLVYESSLDVCKKRVYWRRFAKEKNLYGDRCIWKEFGWLEVCIKRIWRDAGLYNKRNWLDGVLCMKRVWMELWKELT